MSARTDAAAALVSARNRLAETDRQLASDAAALVSAENDREPAAQP